MVIRFKFQSVKDAEKAAKLLPIDCSWSILRDLTTDVYLEVPETYEDLIECYICNVTDVNCEDISEGGVL